MGDIFIWIAFFAGILVSLLLEKYKSRGDQTKGYSGAIIVARDEDGVYLSLHTESRDDSVDKDKVLLKVIRTPNAQK